MFKACPSAPIQRSQCRYVWNRLFELTTEMAQDRGRHILQRSQCRAGHGAPLAQRVAGIKAAKHGRFAGVTPRLLSHLIHASKLQGVVGDDVRAMAERAGRDAFLRQQHAIMDRRDLVPSLRVFPCRPLSGSATATC
jgi:hypothetical protein